VVINNSNKITVINSSDFVKTATISGFNSPRYILPVTYGKAYVSDLYANSVQVVDLNSNTISGSIPCMSGTEQMVAIYNKAFITNSNSDYCYVINTSTDAMMDSLQVGKGSSGICTDKNSKIWVLSSGHAPSGQTGKLTRINPVTLQIEQTMNFNLGESPGKLCVNKTRDTLYYLNNGICQLHIAANALPSNPIISQGSKIFYGLGVNPKDYTIYISDAIDYVQRSKIEIYKPNGTFITKFNAGIISNGFMFE
jgi:DNA-binding beta-propeller fold protein YncE